MQHTQKYTNGWMQFFHSVAGDVLVFDCVVRSKSFDFFSQNNPGVRFGPVGLFSVLFVFGTFFPIHKQQMMTNTSKI